MKTDILDRLLKLQQLRSHAGGFGGHKGRPGQIGGSLPRGDGDFIGSKAHKLPDVAPSKFAYAQSSNGDGYKLALMGFDFASPAELDNASLRFKTYLLENGVAIGKATNDISNLKHSWDFAAYYLPERPFGFKFERFDKYKDYLGKSFFQNKLTNFKGVLDLTPGSTGLKLFDKYKELAFCPTGEGGGIDNSCSPTGEGSGASEKAAVHKDKKITLERQRAVAIETIDKLAASVIGTETEINVRDVSEFSDLSDNQQSEAYDAFVDDVSSSAYEIELENWWKEQSIDEATRIIFISAGEDEWLQDTVKDMLEARDIDLKKSNLLDKEGLIRSDIFNFDSSITTLDDFESSNDNLLNAEDLRGMVYNDGTPVFGDVVTEKNTELLGIPVATAIEDTKLFKELHGELEESIGKRIQDAKYWLDEPDNSHFDDLVSEFLMNDWNSMPDKQKFNYVDVDETETESILISRPSSFEVVDSNVPGYKDTGRLSIVLTQERFKTVAKERGLDDIPSGYINSVWGDWKSDSAKGAAYVMQVAAAEELGGRMYQTREGKDAAWAKKYRQYADDNLDGGFEGMKAYVRAQWEVNQYILKEAGVEYLDVYRAVFVPKSQIGDTQNITVPAFGSNPEGIELNLQALPTLHVAQNGAASFTTNRSVANNWNGVGYKPDDSKRVVIRARVPSEAILSLPVYGQNETNEQEVVVTGLPWRSWDAWLDAAPTIQQWSIEAQRDANGKFKFKAAA